MQWKAMLWKDTRKKKVPCSLNTHSKKEGHNAVPQILLSKHTHWNTELVFKGINVTSRNNVCGKSWCAEILASSTLKSLFSKKDVSLLFKRKAIKIAHIFYEFLWRLVVKINRHFYFIVFIGLPICIYFWKLYALMVLLEASTASIISSHSSILQSWIIKQPTMATLPLQNKKGLHKYSKD